jgi:predicted peptidase
MIIHTFRIRAGFRRLMLGLSLLALTGCAATAPAPSSPTDAGLHPVRLALGDPERSDVANLLLYLPSGYHDARLWPTVLYLHGGSHRGTDLEKLKGYGPPRLAADGHDLPFILIAPQLPEGEIWNDADFLIKLVDELSARYPIDPDRLYVTGTSMGGRGAWYMAYRYPERVAAIAPVAAYQPLTRWASSGRLASIPVRAYHGDQDHLALFDDAVGMHEAHRDAGGTSELIVMPDRDHFIADVLNDPSFYDWLLRQYRVSRGR